MRHGENRKNVARDEMIEMIRPANRFTVRAENRQESLHAT
jgi:hypothetical protein